MYIVSKYSILVMDIETVHPVYSGKLSVEV